MANTTGTTKESEMKRRFTSGNNQRIEMWDNSLFMWHSQSFGRWRNRVSCSGTLSVFLRFLP